MARTLRTAGECGQFGDSSLIPGVVPGGSRTKPDGTRAGLLIDASRAARPQPPQVIVSVPGNTDRCAEPLHYSRAWYQRTAGGRERPPCRAPGVT